MAGIRASAADWNTATRTRPLTGLAALAAACSRASARSRVSSTSPTDATSTSACGVSWTRRPALRSSGVPASFSSRLSCWETADGEKLSASATAARVPRTASSRSSTRRRISSMDIPNQ